MTAKQMKEEGCLDDYRNRIAYTGANMIMLVQITRPLKETHKHKLIPPLLDAVDAGTLKFVPAANFLSHLSEKEQTYLLLVMERDEVSPSLGQAQRLKQLSGEGKREIVKPCFFVLRRRTLTFGAALLMAVAIFGAVNAPAAVRASAATRQLPIY